MEGCSCAPVKHAYLCESSGPLGLKGSEVNVDRHVHACAKVSNVIRMFLCAPSFVVHDREGMS